ncbi:hypothetical protein P0F65_17895 [Sphingomonas sp. I4]
MPPTDVIRYHLGEPIARGTIRVEPLSATGPASIEFKTYAAAVETALLRNGYSLAQGDAQPEFIATVAFTRANRLGPPRPSPFSIGLGGGSFSGGRGGGVGLGGGLSFPWARAVRRRSSAPNCRSRSSAASTSRRSGKVARATWRRSKRWPSWMRRPRRPSWPMRCSPSSPASRAARSR